MVTIEPIRVEIDREHDGRILASVPDLPGVISCREEVWYLFATLDHVG